MATGYYVPPPIDQCLKFKNHCSLMYVFSPKICYLISWNQSRSDCPVSSVQCPQVSLPYLKETVPPAYFMPDSLDLTICKCSRSDSLDGTLFLMYIIIYPASLPNSFYIKSMFQLLICEKNYWNNLYTCQPENSLSVGSTPDCFKKVHQFLIYR